MEGTEPSRREGPRSRIGEGEESEEPEVEAALEEAPEASEDPYLDLSNQHVVSKAEPNFLNIMEKMTQFMGQLIQAVSPRDNSSSPAFKPSSMKATDAFDGTKATKLRGFMQSCQLMVHNDPENFFSDRNKVLYSSSFLTGRAGKWIKPYLSNIYNEDPSYLLDEWQLLETQLFTLLGDPNEVRKSEQELDNLPIKESGHVSLYIDDL
ncbi:hypothetical protein O181_113512 [Austropuccinia psidii MF-1]|uniref:DUF4939 domain-containing protein n=1 Tax=Austropuccinia psidii MF-1 TaxID=1389203 RepID=A0A9Q3K5S6_9BASI|nr:hypothetical protein [Austropuccinia psidii MF-1]